MIKQIYCIFDKKTGAFNNELLILDNDSAAKRYLDCFCSSVRANNPNSPLAMYADDFDLYCVGLFDSNDCISSVYDKPMFVINAGSFSEV